MSKIRTTLKEICDELSDGLHKAPVFTPNDEYLFVNATNLENGHIVDKEPEKHASASEYKKYGILLNDRTILYSIDGTIGNMARYRGEKCILGKGACYLKIKDTVDVDYIYYLLQSAAFKGYIKTMSTGSTIHHISLETMRNFSFVLPDIKEQKKIGRTSALIDSKINSNREIYTELAAMAKTLYDYWFVQFDFPDENGKPYRTSGGEMIWNDQLKREIPKGWRVKHIVDAYNVCYGYPFDTEQFTASDTGNPVIRIRDILEATTSARTLEQVDAKYWVSSGDLLVGMDGNFHMNFWNGKPALLNQRCFKVSTTSFSTLIAYFASMPYIKAREKNVTRTTVGHLSADDVKALQVLYPDDKIREKISSSFDSILTKMCSLKEENRELTKLRDWLLPMLMNGQAAVE